jgi:hypothetical protein
VTFHPFLVSFLVCSAVSHNVLELSFVLTTHMRWNSVPLDSVVREVLCLKISRLRLEFGLSHAPNALLQGLEAGSKMTEASARLASRETS